MEEDNHEVWLREAGELISNARRHPETLEPALRQLSRRAFRDFLFSPSIILDYMVVSTPCLFGEAGYSDVEVDKLMQTIDRIIGEEWAARIVFMSLPANLGKPKPLAEIVDLLDELPSWSWLYILKETREINLALECFPAEIDSRQVSDEEIEDFEAAVAAAGFISFLNPDQIRDIIENLRLQRKDYTPADLEKAIDFYWRHDAFIVLAGDLA